MKKSKLLIAICSFGALFLSQESFCWVRGAMYQMERDSLARRLDVSKEEAAKIMKEKYEKEKMAKKRERALKWEKRRYELKQKVGSMRKAIGRAKNKISGGFSSGFSKVKTGIQGRSFRDRFLSRKQGKE